MILLDELGEKLRTFEGLPLISAMMPAYNSEKHIVQAIESILAQTYKNWELIVVDDGSTDETPRIVSNYASNHKRIKYHRIDHGGRGVARIKCIELSAGKYIAVCDSDDISLPERFEKQVLFLENHLEIGVVSAQVKFFSDDLHLQNIYQYPECSDEIRSYFNRGKMGISHAASMFRRELIEFVGSYCEECLRAQDLEFFLRVNEVSLFVTLPEVLLLYRNNPSNMSFSFWIRLHKYSRYAVYRREMYKTKIEPKKFDHWCNCFLNKLKIYFIESVRYCKYVFKYKLSAR
jgi:glycosyltransferase involved in cell wall biosynthesis